VKSAAARLPIHRRDAPFPQFARAATSMPDAMLRMSAESVVPPRIPSIACARQFRVAKITSDQMRAENIRQDSCADEDAHGAHRKSAVVH
jgi:hypothetical protein